MKKLVERCGGTVEYLELPETRHYTIILGLSDSFLKNNTMLASIDGFLKKLSEETSTFARID